MDKPCEFDGYCLHRDRMKLEMQNILTEKDWEISHSPTHMPSHTHACPRKYRQMQVS